MRASIMYTVTYWIFISFSSLLYVHTTLVIIILRCNPPYVWHCGSHVFRMWFSFIVNCYNVFFLFSRRCTTCLKCSNLHYQLEWVIAAIISGFSFRSFHLCKRTTKICCRMLKKRRIITIVVMCEAFTLPIKTKFESLDFQLKTILNFWQQTDNFHYRTAWMFFFQHLLNAKVDSWTNTNTNRANSVAMYGI